MFKVYLALCDDFIILWINYKIKLFRPFLCGLPYVFYRFTCWCCCYCFSCYCCCCCPFFFIYFWIRSGLLFNLIVTQIENLKMTFLLTFSNIFQHFLLSLISAFRHVCVCIAYVCHSFLSPSVLPKYNFSFSMVGVLVHSFCTIAIASFFHSLLACLFAVTFQCIANTWIGHVWWPNEKSCQVMNAKHRNVSCHLLFIWLYSICYNNT